MSWWIKYGVLWLSLMPHQCKICNSNIDLNSQRVSCCRVNNWCVHWWLWRRRSHMAALVEDCTGIYAQTCSSIVTDVVQPNLGVGGMKGYWSLCWSKICLRKFWFFNIRYRLENMFVILISRSNAREPMYIYRLLIHDQLVFGQKVFPSFHLMYQILYHIRRCLTYI